MNNPLDVIKKDHEMLFSLFTEYEGLDEEAVTEKSTLCEQITRELLMHSDMEETLCYPQFKEILSEEMESIIAEAYLEHEEIENTLSTLSLLESDSTEFDTHMKECLRRMREHMHAEEEKILPLIQAKAPPEVLGALGDDLITFKESRLGVAP